MNLSSTPTPRGACMAWGGAANYAWLLDALKRPRSSDYRQVRDRLRDSGGPWPFHLAEFEVKRVTFIDAEGWQRTNDVG